MTVNEIHDDFLVVAAQCYLVINIHATVLGYVPEQVNGFAWGIFLTHDLNNFPGCHFEMFLVKGIGKKKKVGSTEPDR